MKYFYFGKKIGTIGCIFGSFWPRQPKHPLLPFVEFLQGFLVEACLPIAIAHLREHRLNLRLF